MKNINSIAVGMRSAGAARALRRGRGLDRACDGGARDRAGGRRAAQAPHRPATAASVDRGPI